MGNTDGPLIAIFGEVHTALLRNSVELPGNLAERLLAPVPGRRADRHERPIAHVRSPSAYTGVDCGPPTLSRTRARVVGTVERRGLLTAGRVLQGAATVHIGQPPGAHRQPWSYYLARPGRLEVIGKTNARDLVDGFLDPRRRSGTLDLGAICGRTIDAVQADPALDRRPAVRAARTRLRWAVELDDDADPVGEMQVRVEDEQLRTLRFRGGPAHLAEIAEFCADLALHDWLLTTMIRQVDQGRIGMDAPERVLDRLGAALDQLGHLWMPAARSGDLATALWDRLEYRPGFTRQWRALVDRIRDQMTLGAATSGRRAGTMLKEGPP